ncbi:MAG: hypothetical protein IJB57_02360 [Clostridia bacterium]|nr:hypothetical protein [Clostridia bacterium]
MNNNFYDIAFNDSLTFYTFKLYCSPKDRKIVNCTEEFYNQGFLKNLRWDKYAEYTYKCKDCPYFKHNIGFYFGDNHYTNDFSNKEFFVINVKSTEELNLVVENLPTNTKTIWISSTKPINYSALEKLTQLQTVCIGLGAKDILWNMEKTPDLDVLEIQLAANAPEISVIKKAKGLRHLCLITHTSQINNTVIPTFSFLKEMPNLDSLVISGVSTQDNNIEDLINIPNLRRLWISPHIYSTEDYAKFEALKFKIYSEYGIYRYNKEEATIAHIRPLGKGKRYFKTEKSKDKFIVQYKKFMQKYL